MLKQTRTTKIPTGHALKKRLLNLEYQTKIVGLVKTKKKSHIEETFKGDYRIIVLRTSKLAGVEGSIQTGGGLNTLHQRGQGNKPIVTVKRIKKTVFNTINGVKNLKLSTPENKTFVLTEKLPISYVYTVNPPATNLREQYEHFALLAPYIPIKTLFGKGVNDNASGFVGCLIASPSKSASSFLIDNAANDSELVFYYPSQLKTWLSHLADSSHTEIIHPLNGLADVFQVLDQPALNVLTHVNSSSLTTISLLTNLPEKKSDSK